MSATKTWENGTLRRAVAAAVPPQVREYFRSRGYRKAPWPAQVWSVSRGWIEVDSLIPLYRHGVLMAPAWPVDTTHVSYTDGQARADFGVNELRTGGLITGP